MLAIQQEGGFKVIGISVRTKTVDELFGQGKIGPLWRRFYFDQIFNRIPQKLSDKDMIAVYYDYESDVHGPYSVMVGAKVEKNAPVPEGLESIEVPSLPFARISSEKGQTPDIVIGAWEKVFALTDNGTLQRRYAMDFEIYDERALDPNEAQIDVFISVK